MRVFHLSLFLASFVVTACINGSPKQTSNAQVPAPSQTTEATSSESAATAEQQYMPVEHPIVNVYMETSGSMNGYVNSGKTQFQQAVFDYLSNINNIGLPSEMNLYYINSQLTPKGNDVDGFINTLTARSMLNAPGNKATTDLAELMKTVLDATDNQTLSIFISDCIFSPGSVPQPAAYLENQKIAIRNAVSNYLQKNKLMACSVYQLNSDFNGTYFDFKNKGRRISQQRPFYIWVFGNLRYLLQLKLYIPDGKFLGAKVENTWTIFNGDNIADTKYGLLMPNPMQEKYKWVDNNSLKNISKNKEGLYRFTFGADMRMLEVLYGKDYIMDLRNFKHLINKMTAEEFRGEIVENTVSESPFTYNFTIQSEIKPAKGDLDIVLEGEVPTWVYESTDLDDSTFSGINAMQTYGFKYMCEGIYEGYHVGGASNITAFFHFNILN